MTFVMSRRLLGSWMPWIAAGLLLGCGGGGGDGGSGPPPPAATLSLFAGSLPREGSADGPSASAQFLRPEGVVQDSAGNIYIADTGNHTIRKLTPQGSVSTLAGLAGQSGSADGPGNAARFSAPYAVVVDAAGVVYVADTANHVIRRISSAGVVSTFAGATGQSGSADGVGAAARFFSPTDLALDVSGNLFVADRANGVVRKITPNASVTTFAGTAGAVGSPAKGDGPQARFGTITGVAADAAGNVYVVEGDPIETGFGDPHLLRKFNSQAQAVPLGTEESGMVQLRGARGLAIDGAGNLYVPTSAIFGPSPTFTQVLNSMLKITPQGGIQTLAGSDFFARNGAFGSADGPGATARFRSPQGVAVGNNGQVLVADTGNHTIRQIDGTGVVTTVAGRASIGAADAAGADARFFIPSGLAVQDDGTLVVGDTGNRALRTISPAGLVSTRVLAGATTSPFYSLAADPTGLLYAESTLVVGFPAIVKIDLQGAVSGFSEGVNGGSRGNTVAVDREGNVYFRDGQSASGVVRITRAGVRSVVAPNARPLALAVDAAGVVYMVNADNTVLALRTTGVVDVLAGRAGEEGLRDGPGADARFNFSNAAAIAVDARGNVYVTQEFTVRRITPDGVVSTIAGAQGQNETVLGALPGRLGQVRALAWSNGSLYATVGDAVLRIGPLN